MKTILKKIVVYIFTLFSCFFCCCTNNPNIVTTNDSRIFVQNGNSMTDGVLIYHRLPDRWSYTGSFSYEFGVVQGGNILCASDRNGTFVQEKKSWYSDMGYTPWVVSDFELPQLLEDSIDVHVSVRQKGSFVLSEQALSEFMSWYYDYSLGKIASSMKSDMQPFATIWFSLISIPDLHYDCGLQLIEEQGTILIMDDSWMVICSIEPDTALFQEIQRDKGINN